MKTKTDVSLNGILLSDLDQKIIIQGIEEAAPSWNITATSLARRYGQRVTQREYRYRDVTVRFAIAEISNMQEREDILQAVRDWARNPGWMKVSYREGQRIWATCNAMPQVAGINRWAEAYAIVFRAWSMPEWEAEEADSATAAGISGSTQITVQPSAGGPMRIEAGNSSGGICNAISVTAAGQTMSFGSLGLRHGETFVMDYDENGLQRIRIRSAAGIWRSVLESRSEESVDDILLAQGTSAISFTAGASLNWRFYAYGRWAG